MDTLEQQLTHLYSEVGGDAGVLGIDRPIAFSATIEKARASGLLDKLTDADLESYATFMLRQIDSKQGGVADSMIRDAAAGKVILSGVDDARLDMMATLGNGRRKLYRHITATDIEEMILTRQKHARSSVRASASFETDGRQVISRIAAFGTLGAAAVAGALNSLESA